MIGIYNTNYNNNYLNQNYSYQQPVSYNNCFQQQSIFGGYGVQQQNTWSNNSQSSSLMPMMMMLMQALMGQNTSSAGNACSYPGVNVVNNGNIGGINISNLFAGLLGNGTTTVDQTQVTVEEKPKKVYIISNNNHGNNDDTLKEEVQRYDKKVDLSDEFMAAVNKFANSSDPAAQKINAEYGTKMAKKAIIIDEDGKLIGVRNTKELSAELGGIKLGGNVNKNTAAGKSIGYGNQNYEIAENVFASPLTFDLNGDGVKTSDKIVEFDINGDGKLDKINDVADGTLSIRGGKDGKDLFGDNTDLDGDGKADGFKNGFEALKALAKKESLINGKDDMILDAKDIKILEEKYDFGMKTEGYNSKEKSLSELGITEINLGSTEETTSQDNFDGQNNLLMEQEGTTFKMNGKEREYADVWHGLKG